MTVKETNYLKVLLVEDDENHAKIIYRLVSKIDNGDVVLTWANDLKSGIKYLNSERFDVLLLDLRLPDSGINDTLRSVLNVSHDIPIVVLSSLEDRFLARKLVQEGAQDYLCKVDLNVDLLQRTLFTAIERKKIEIELQESEARKSKIIESSLDCIISVDEFGRILEFNPAAEKTLGFEKGDVIGRHLPDLFFPHHLREEYRKSFDGKLLSGDSRILGKRFEVKVLQNNSNEIPVEIAFTAIQLKGKKVFTGFFRDISFQKRVSEEMRVAKELAEAANRAKTSFLANMSHEIRTPLGAVLGFSELILNPFVTDSDRSQYSEIIRRNGDLLSKIINDVLDLSKIEAEKFDIKKEKVLFRDLIDDALLILNLKAKSKDLNLNIDISDDVPNVIWTDPLRLKQILLNIIGNAIKFTEAGDVSVKVFVENPLAKPIKISFLVKDSGRGIDKENYEKLFVPFNQIDNSASRAFGGTGLGLVLAKRLSQLLGGDVTLDSSQIGAGSTFNVTIEAEVVTDFESTKAIEKAETPKDINQVLRGVRVLLVDDSGDNRLLVSRVLSFSGAKVDMAENGLEALLKTKENGDYSVLLMDLQMPVMDGYEATAILRNEGFKKPILALTAHAMIEERHRCLENGFNAHLSKPIDREVLVDAVSRFAKV